MGNKYPHEETDKSLSHILDRLWQKINNSGKSGIKEWVTDLKQSANRARDLEKRNRESEKQVEEHKSTIRGYEIIVSETNERITELEHGLRRADNPQPR
jgi:chromosome segregation ATPase